MGNEASVESGGTGLVGAQLQLPAGTDPDLSRLSPDQRRQITALLASAQGPAHRHPEAGAAAEADQPAAPPDGIPERALRRRSVSTSSLPDPRPDTELWAQGTQAKMMPSFLSEGNPLSAVSSVVNKFSLFDSKPESDEAARKQKAARGAEPAARGPVKSSSQQFVKREEREAAGRQQQQQQYSVPRIAPVPKKTLCPICNTAEIVGSPGTGQCNQCTQCQLLVCAQCGFNPNPHLSQVREWLCLNCQMQRALGIDMTSVPSSKPQPLQPKQQGVTSSAPQAAKQAPAQQPAPKPEQAKSLSHSGSRKQPVLTKQQSMVASPPLKTKQPSHGPRDPQPKQQASQKPQPAKPSQQLLDQKKQQDLNKPPQQLNSTAQGAERKQPSQSPQFQQKDAKPVSQDQQLAKKQEDSFISTQQQLQKKDNSVPGTELDTGVKDQKQDVTQQKQSVQVQKPVDKTQPPSVSTAGPEVSKQPVPKGESKAAPPKEEQAKLAQKPPAAKVVPSQISATPKAQKPPEQSRRFSLNLGGSAQPPPFQPSTPPETVTGKLFGFGASLFSQASTLISAAPQQQDQHGHTAKQPPQTACKDSSVPQPSPKRDIGKKETKPSAAVDTFEQKAVGAAQTNTTDPAIIKKAAVVKESKPGAEMIKPTTKPLETGKAAPPKSTCPLCKTDLNIGSEAPPNFNTCTECKAVVCNLCGFNPMPHLTEVQEWLCLTCQTQRALSGQLGDLGKMPPPHSISSKPKQTVPAQSGPKQSQKDPSSAGSSKPSADQPTIPQTKEMQPEKVNLITTAQKDAETKEMAVKPAAKPIEAPTVVKQETSLDQDLKVTKQITKQKFATDEDQNLPPEPVAKEDAVKQVEETAAPKKLESVIEKEETAIKVMKSEEATSDSAVQKQPSEVIKVQNEQLKTPDLAQTDKEKVTMEKEEEKSDSSAIQQQRSPQGLSDTGYSSDGISSSLGEIPTLLQSEDKDLLKEPARKDSISQESSPSSPSDLAKLESTVLSILEAQANTVHHEKSGQHKDPYGPYSDHERERHRPRTLSITPESYSSDEEDLEDIQEEDEEALEDHDHEDKIASQDYNESYGSQGDEAIRRQRYDSLEDSSESEHSPCPHRQRKVSIGSSSSDSQGSGDEEDFIRKQIIEMSAEEDASGSEEDEYIRTQLKEISGKGRLESKGPTVKHKRLSKRSSSSHDDDPGRRHSWHDVDDDDDDEEVYDESPEAKYRETKSQDNEDLSLSAGGGLRRFKTIDLNSTITNKYVEDGSEIKNDRLYYEEEPELEMESLTDSPEDRSRGEGSSSLHATSSFTPGTSPTSVSSLDEDSDSSPSHKKMLGESKQQRKARHRSPGPLLPTIEDSSEEEELREEEELLREQEKQRELEQQQRKSSTKKSKKDKDELRAQRRRERPKTPPSNLSPIEDASPTEELRQAAEMEELHRSSCSEYSPSIESEPEGFEIHPEKILEVQKVYKLPTSVSLYSPTDENAGSTMHEVDAISQRSLKSAEEAYEEMMQKAKLLKNQKEPDDVFDKEPLYGGMLIEDYIYESLVEDKYNETMDNRFLNTGLETSTGLVQGSEKKLRSPDEIYEEIMQKNTNVDDAQCLHYRQPLGINLHPQDLPSSVPFAKETFVAFPLDTSEASTKIEKQLLDADAAYEELMKRQSALLTPGTSPTQPSSPDSMSAESEATSDSSLTSTAASNVVQDKPLTSMALFGTKPVQISSINGMMHAIPDVKITQHFSIEDDVDVEYGEQYYIDNRGISYETAQIVEQSKPGMTASSTASTSTVTSKAFPVAPTVTTTISSPVCSTGSVGGSRTTDFVVLSITTSEDNYTSTPTPRSTVKTTVTPLASTAGGMSQVHPTSTTSSSGLSAGSGHVLISVPPNLDSSDVLTSTAVTSAVLETSQLLNKQSSLDSISDKTITSVSVTAASVQVAVCGFSGMTDPTSVVTLPVSLPGKVKIATTSSPASGFSVSTTLTHSVTITPSQAQITTKGPSLPSERGSPFIRSSAHSPTHSPFPVPPPPPPPPPLPPPAFPKSVTIPKKRSTTDVSICKVNTLDQRSVTATGKIFHPMPPPVPPKPASIPSALVFTTRPTDGIRPAIPPKPSLPHLPISVHRPSESQHKPLNSNTTLSLNLTSPGDFKLISPTSPISPHSNKSSPKLTMHSQATYVVITLPSEPGTPTEPITCQASSIQSSVSSSKGLPPAMSLAHFTKSLETQKIIEKGKTETVYFYQSLAQGVVSTVEHEMSTEVPQPPASMLYDKIPGRGTVSVAITIPPERKYFELPQFPENGRTLEHMAQFTTDVIDLRTLSNLDVDMTDNGMDLSTFSVDGGRHALVIDSSGLRHISTIQPAIVNLSKTESDEQISVSTLAISTGSMTVVTCTGSATFTATTDTLEGPVDLGHSVSIPLPLTTKVDEATYNAARCQSPATDTIEVPINLTYSTAASISGWSSNKPVMKAPGSTTNGWTDVESTEVEAVDLSTTKPHRMMVSVDELTTGIVTTIVEEEDKPVDLTAGRRNVCCDMVYKFPFGRSCSSLTQQPASTLPEDRYGYRDDHYSYGHGATHGYRGFGSMKPSMSDTNLAEAGLFLYKSKHSFDYCNSSTDAAVDLTAGKLTTGELMDYSAVCTQPQDHLSKGTLSYPETRQVITDSGMSQYSQARVTPTIGSHYGMQSVLRSSGGVVYSSVATPIPSTFAITTQPGSIFSTSLSLHSSDTMPSLSALQHIQPVPRSSSYLTTADTGREMGLGASQGLDTSGLMSNLTTISATYHDTSSEVNFIPTETDYTQKHSIEPVAVSKLSPMTSPVSEENKHLLIEREMLEFEKMKQIRLAEELERERHEIQIFREQEKLIVQRELQELQTMKQQLLYQQEEERQAQFIIQQETIAQQQMQLEQIQQLQQQLQQQLEEQKIRQIYQYTYDPSGSSAPQTTTDQAIIESQYTTAENGQFWHAQDINTTAPAMMGQEPQPWYTAQSEGIPQHLPQPCMLSSVSEMSLKDIDAREGRVLRKRSSMPRLGGQYSDDIDGKMQDLRSYKKIVDSGVQTDDEEGTERCYTSRKRRTKKSVDSSVQTDDEDNQEDWDIPSRRRKSRIGKYADGGAEMEKAKRPHFAKLSNIAMQTVAEISVQTEPEGIIRTPSIRAQVESKIEIVKHISAPEKTYKGESLGCQTETDSDGQSPQYLTHKVITVVSPQKTDKKRPTPLEIGYSNHLRADSAFQVVPSPPKSPKVLYSPISPMTPSKETAFVPYEKSPSVDKNSQKLMALEPPKHQPLSPRTIKVIQRSMSDPKPLSPTAEENSRLHFQYNDSFLAKGSQNNTPVGTQKKVKRTLPNPPPEEAGLVGSQATFPTVNSVSHRRVCRTNTMARAKILQDIDRELELVERESSKLRKKQAELDEEEKEIDAKLRYLEMGINRRKEALLKEREKRERAYLQGVAEERDYMSDSEVSNIRETRMEAQCGLERPRTAPQPDYDQFLSPQTQSQPQYATTPSHYTQYQYPTPPLTQTQTQYQQQSPFQEQALYQQVSPYQTPATYQTVPTITYQQQPPPSQTQPTAYPHPSQMMLIQQKPRQTTVVDLEPKITTNYEVIHNQSLLMASTSADSTYVVPHLGSKYSNLDLRIGLDERGTMAGSPMSSLSAESYYADLEHRAPRNYVLIDDIGELTKGSSSLATGFNLHDIQKQVQKNERLLRTSEARRTADMKDFIGPLQSSARLHSFGKADEDTMEDPYELKLLKQQIKQEFRRGAEGLEHLSSLPQYYHADSSYRHFPKSEKYSISRLTLEKQAAKQLPPSIIYQKQSKHKKQLLDPKFSKFSPIQEARDVEPDFTNYMGTTSSVTGAPTRARLIQDDVTFSLRKNIRDQQKFLGPTVRSTFDDEIDKAYTSGSRSRPSSVYGLDLTIKRDPSSTSLRIKGQENDPLDIAYGQSSPSVRTKPSSLPISHSRGRITIVAQNSEEESPLSPVGQPMGMARAAAGPLPPISADTREQFGSSHSLPEVQQHMREESRTRGYDRDIAFIMDDFQHAMSDSEGVCTALKQLTEPNQTKFIEMNSYHLRREETDWFDKPRESRLEDAPAINRKLPEKLTHSRQSQQQSTEGGGKLVQYNFPHSRIRIQRDLKDQTVSGNGLGIRIIGGKEIPGRNGEIGAYIAKIFPGGHAEQSGKLAEGMQVLEWNGIPLTGKTYEEVQGIIGVPIGEAEICVRLDLNMLSDLESLQHLELHSQAKAGEKQKSPGVDPKQLAAELQKVSQEAPSVITSATEKGTHSHSGTTSATSSAAPSPGQPGSPAVSKKRHSSKPPETASKSHPITGEIQLQMNYDKHIGNLIVHVLQARNLAPRDNNGYSDPFVKVYLLPGRGIENKRRTKHVQKSINPEWNQTVIYKSISMEQLKKKTLEVTIWDYDRLSSNDFLGEVLIDLSNTSHFDNTLRWYPLKEQAESIDHARSHSGQNSQQSPKPSVIKSRSHGIFPDPSKEMHVATIEKSQSSPASSKSSSEGHLRSHGPSRSQSKTSVTQTHLEDAGAAIAAAEAAVQQLRLQPTHKSGQAQSHARKHRHSIAGVPIQRTQSDNLPSPANENKDQSQLAIRKVMSEGSPKSEGARSTSHRTTESSISTASSISSVGSGYSEGSTPGGEYSVFTAPQMGKMSQDTDLTMKGEKHKVSDQLKQQGLGLAETDGKTQVMGEIKIALKKEMKTDGEQLIVEILQCRNITYKFKSPDHLPDLYVKLYVINISTQKRTFKKKTRVCRHDREPSFNETFRFSLNPAGHSLQILLVSNGGKFMRKTLIGEAYICLDKVDLRKRMVNWHKLFVSSTESQRGAAPGFNLQN
ncbi:protein piccolo isoform X3 [Chiloscyllium punctatum]|uniref:protein piccolo isoform X3 n=1 Tax=Chiloscyllium punctatum TaxID=137246 RepID=UPI003B63D4EB